MKIPTEPQGAFYATWSGPAFKADEEMNARAPKGWEVVAVTYLGDTDRGGPMVMVTFVRVIFTFNREASGGGMP